MKSKCCSANYKVENHYEGKMNNQTVTCSKCGKDCKSECLGFDNEIQKHTDMNTFYGHEILRASKPCAPAETPNCPSLQGVPAEERSCGNCEFQCDINNPTMCLTNKDFSQWQPLSPPKAFNYGVVCSKCEKEICICKEPSEDLTANVGFRPNEMPADSCPVNIRCPNHERYSAIKCKDCEVEKVIIHMKKEPPKEQEGCPLIKIDDESIGLSCTKPKAQEPEPTALANSQYKDDAKTGWEIGHNGEVVKNEGEGIDDKINKVLILENPLTLSNKVEDLDILKSKLDTLYKQKYEREILNKLNKESRIEQSSIDVWENGKKYVLWSDIEKLLKGEGE